jgi:release factor H-coupled RctB family protein
MPDLHPGRGIPIGAVFLFEGQVLPDLVGGDAGCGVLVIVGYKDGRRGDALERSVLSALDEPLLPDVDPHELMHAAWHRGPLGLVSLPGVPDALAEVAARLGAADVTTDASGALPMDGNFAEQLGSLGGGNHFAEISRVDKIADKARAKALGLRGDAQVVLVHSGSRGLGSLVAGRYAGKVLGASDADSYLADLRGAVRYARTNRLLVAWRLLRAAGIGSSARVALLFDIVHNAVERSAPGVFLHRKGAAPAACGQATVVLGSRGAPSWLMCGLGNEQSLCSVAHGAGRRMARSEAYDKLRARHTRESLKRSALGTRVFCDDTTLMYEEHPDAYKPIEPIIASLEEAGAALRVASLVPLITVKR